jgi:fructose-bisphosphate aldolase, class II
MIASLTEILIPARAAHYAVGAFEFWSLDSAQAVVDAAEEAGMPVILQGGSLEINYAGGIDRYTKIGRMVAEQAKVKVALHLDHGETIDLARHAINAGFTSVMIDASAMPFEDNVALTRQVVALAKPHGVTVEAELGKLVGTEGGKSLSDAEAAQTDPGQARAFVEQTQIDALAVAIGTVHGFYQFAPKLNLDRLKKISDRISIPLVLHGGSGTPDDQVRQTIGLGIAKINICTEFLAAYGRAFSSEQAKAGFKYSVPALFGPAKNAGRELALSKIKLFSNGARSY